MNDAVKSWGDGASTAISEISTAMGQVSDAAGSSDLTALGIACERAKGGTDDLQARLPTPDPDLTDAVQKAITDYSAGTRICTTAVENGNINDFEQGSQLITDGNNALDAATEIVKRDLGN